jgi:hypothetical protein
MSIVLCVRPIVGTTQRLKVTRRRESTDRERERGTESSNRDWNGPLHDDQWTLVQNPRKATLRSHFRSGTHKRWEGPDRCDDFREHTRDDRCSGIALGRCLRDGVALMLWPVASPRAPSAPRVALFSFCTPTSGYLLRSTLSGGIRLKPTIIKLS